MEVAVANLGILYHKGVTEILYLKRKYRNIKNLQNATGKRAKTVS